MWLGGQTSTNAPPARSPARAPGRRARSGGGPAETAARESTSFLRKEYSLRNFEGDNSHSCCLPRAREGNRERITVAARTRRPPNQEAGRRHDSLEPRLVSRIESGNETLKTVVWTLKPPVSHFGHGLVGFASQRAHGGSVPAFKLHLWNEGADVRARQDGGGALQPHARGFRAVWHAPLCRGRAARARAQPAARATAAVG